MAVLNKDDFFKRINSAFGTDASDDSISFIEDMTDTYNDMEQRANSGGTDWEKRYHELDESWRKKYQSRFFSNTNNNYRPANDNDEDANTNKAETIQIKDLFTVK